MTSALTRLLLVEDNPGDARLLELMLHEGGVTTAVTHVTSMAAAESTLAREPIDIVLLDLGLPDAQGLAGVGRARAAAPRVPVVVLTGLDDESVAVEALKGGAQDYLVKGQIESRGLLRALRYAIERAAMEATLFLERDRAQVTLNCIAEAVACTDLAGNITFLNTGAETMAGWAIEEAVGRPMAEILPILDVTSRAPVSNPVRIEKGRHQSLALSPNCVLVRRDGVDIPIAASIAPIHDGQGQCMGTVIVFRDVRLSRAVAVQMTHAAEHDFLTSLPNRMLLNDRVTQAIALAARHQKKVAVLFLDLDGFKHINDSLGHPTGDKLLQSVARRLVKCVRSADTVSRQGGDEFVVMLSEMERSEDAAISARRMLDAIAETHSIHEQDLHVTASIGISVFPDDGTTAETLVKNADTAMYQAKESGRHGYQFFTAAMNVRAVERQWIEEGLRQALERKEFALHYQPKVDLRTGEITGAEALLRWTHPTKGAVSPAQFIPVAEDSGLIVPIGNWVLREACRQAQEWVAAGLHPGAVAVNVSAVEFRAAGFLAGVDAILVETGLDPASLELELTESVLMKRAESTAVILGALRARGVRVSVDDFGTGYSSLSYLRRFPVDILKIDQSFVRQIASSSADAAIVKAVIGMGRSLTLRVIAEGIETEDELAFLRAHECDEGQGYYFSRPVPADQFAALLRTGISRAGLPARVLPAAPALLEASY